MKYSSFTNQAIDFRNALEEWLYTVEKTRQLTAFTNFSPDGRPKEPDWAERMAKVRGELVQKHEYFIQELDAFMKSLNS